MGDEYREVPEFKFAKSIPEVDPQLVKALYNDGKAKSTEQILEERGKVHGDWSNNARASAEMFATFEQICEKSGKTPIPEIMEAIRMALHKIGRMASGDIMEIDHWADAIGYLTLGKKYIEKLQQRS